MHFFLLPLNVDHPQGELERSSIKEISCLQLHASQEALCLTEKSS